MKDRVRDVVEAAHMVLVWMGMDHRGTSCLIPDTKWSKDELTLRSMHLRHTLKALEEVDFQPSIAHIIFLNDGPMAVVLDDAARAEAKLTELKEADYNSVRAQKGMQYTFEDYCNECHFWYIRELRIT